MKQLAGILLYFYRRDIKAVVVFVPQKRNSSAARAEVNTFFAPICLEKSASKIVSVENGSCLTHIF